MSFILQPWQLFVAIIAGWIHRQQQEAIEYLRTENRVLIEPAQERKRQTTWATFLKAHWDLLGSIDFTTIEVSTKGGLVTVPEPSTLSFTVDLLMNDRLPCSLS